MKCERSRIKQLKNDRVLWKCRQRVLTAVLTAFCLLFAGGCSLQTKTEPISCPQLSADEFPIMDGSTATIPIGQAMFRLSSGASQEEAEAFVRFYGTTESYGSLQAGDADLIISYAPEEVLFQALSADPGIEIKPIGRDALVFLKNAGNSVASLTREELRGIYAGRIRNWRETGGSDKEIIAFQRPAGSGSQNLMEKLLMQGAEMAKAPAAFTAGEMGDLIEAVASYDNTENALGYSVYYYAKNMYQRPKLSFLSVDGIPPETETIRDGSYPLTNDFYAAIRSEEPADSSARRLFEWLTEPDGQALLNALGYAALTDDRRALPEDFFAAEADKKAQTDADAGAHIALEPGQAVLLDGSTFFGEYGIAVCDERLNMVGFIPNLILENARTVKLCRKEAPTVLIDPEKIRLGLYLLTEERWLYEPEYVRIDENERGFLLFPDEGSAGDFDALYPCLLLDKEGGLIERGTFDALWPRFSEKTSEVTSPEAFAVQFPDILRQHGAEASDITYWYDWGGDPDGRPAFLIRSGDDCYAYAADGSFLLHLQISELRAAFPEALRHQAEELTTYVSAPQRCGAESFLLQIPAADGQQLRIYEKGEEKRKIKLPESEYLSTVGDGFYVTVGGNYNHFYDLSGRRIRSLLSGRTREDS